MEPIEAYLRRESGAYLDPWHDRLKTAYVDTLADLGVTKDLSDAEFLAAMEHHKDVNPAMAAVLSAIKATVKGGIGKLFENPQGKGYKDGAPWPAMQRPTWRPDIRAAVISKARVNMHRKMLNMAKLTGRYPLAVQSDCVVYPAPSPCASPKWEPLIVNLARGMPCFGFRPLTTGAGKPDSFCVVNIADVPLGRVYVYEPSADTGKPRLPAVPLNTAVTCVPSGLVHVFSWRPLGTAVGAAIEPVPLEDPYTLISAMLHQKPDAATHS
ncbi:UNVERIFIED_CONTAM: hypothetical protein RKD50_009253 [Streptomyces canus]